MSVTARDLVESVTGLRQLAADLRATANQKTVPMPKGDPCVMARPEGLASGADFIDRVCDELLLLVPDVPITTLAEEEDEHG